MFWMVVAPELVLAWAVRQFFAAKDIRDAYNNSREGEWSPLRLTLLVRLISNRNSSAEPVDIGTWPLTWHGGLYASRPRP